MFLIAGGLGLAAALTVGVLWTRGRIHGAWLIVAVAAMVASPSLVSEALYWPGG